MEKYLFRVTLRGMTVCPTGKAYGVAYVVAANLSEAYQKVRDALNDKDIGFTRDRGLANIEVVADTSWYSDTEYMLYL